MVKRCGRAGASSKRKEREREERERERERKEHRQFWGGSWARCEGAEDRDGRLDQKRTLRAARYKVDELLLSAGQSEKRGLPGCGYFGTGLKNDGKQATAGDLNAHSNH